MLCPPAPRAYWYQLQPSCIVCSPGSAAFSTSMFAPGLHIFLVCRAFKEDYSLFWASPQHLRNVGGFWLGSDTNSCTLFPKRNYSVTVFQGQLKNVVNAAGSFRFVMCCCSVHQAGIRFCLLPLVPLQCHWVHEPLWHSRVPFGDRDPCPYRGRNLQVAMQWLCPGWKLLFGALLMFFLGCCYPVVVFLSPQFMFKFLL